MSEHTDDSDRTHDDHSDGRTTPADLTAEASESHPTAGKADIDHETTAEVDGRLITRPQTLIEKDAGGAAHDVTDWAAAAAAEPPQEQQDRS